MGDRNAFRLEDPNQPPPTIATLLQVAEAFDVDLNIHFGSFSEMVKRIDGVTPESFEVRSFDEELKDGAFVGHKGLGNRGMGQIRKLR